MNEKKNEIRMRNEMQNGIRRRPTTQKKKKKTAAGRERNREETQKKIEDTTIPSVRYCVGVIVTRTTSTKTLASTASGVPVRNVWISFQFAHIYVV